MAEYYNYPSAPASKPQLKCQNIVLPVTQKFDYSITYRSYHPRSNFNSVNLPQTHNVEIHSDLPIPIQIDLPNPIPNEISSIRNSEILNKLRGLTYSEVFESIDEDNEVNIVNQNNSETVIIEEIVPKSVSEKPNFSVEKVNFSSQNASLNEINNPEESRPPLSWDSEFEWDSNIASINRSLFGNDRFRKNQREIINALLSKRDVFARLPTGAGKSLTYQLATVYMPGITIVIQPLVALIADQVQKLRSLGLHSEILDSEDRSVIREILHEMVTGDQIKFLFITPEKLKKNSNVKRLLEELDARNKINFFVIDEAHCIDIWGKSFRPEYSQLGEFKEQYPNVPVMCLTGSITRTGIEKIVKSLKINPECFIENSERKNIFYEVIHQEPKRFDQLLNLIKMRLDGKTGIIFHNNREECENLSEKLNWEMIDCKFFHAELSYSCKREILREWQSGKFKIVVATSSFGMGIDNKNLDFVIHYSMPKNLSDYYQESGRGGRDSQVSTSIIIYKFNHRSHALSFYTQNSDDSEKKEYLTEIHKILEFCENEKECRKVLISQYFGDYDNNPCETMCDNCINRNIKKTKFEVKDYTVEAKVIIDVVIKNQYFFTIQQLKTFLLGKSEKYTENEYHGKLRYCDESILNKIILKLLQKKNISESISTIQKNNFERLYFEKFLENEEKILLDHKLLSITNFPIFRNNVIEIDENSDDQVSNSNQFIRKEVIDLDDYDDEFQEIPFDENDDLVLLPRVRPRGF